MLSRDASRGREVALRSFRPGHVICWAAVASLAAWAPSALADAEKGEPDPGVSRAAPIPVQLKTINEIHITSLGRVTETAVPAIELGVCPVTVTHTDAPFEGGGQFIAQAGFAQQETAAAQYTLAPTEFPAQFVSADIIFATSNAQVQTVTEWSILIWSGNPQTGQLIGQYFSDDKLIPHLRMNPGTNGTRISFQVDPTDPEQVFIPAPSDGSNTITIGFRVEKHNAQTQNPCFVAPPSNANAFPVTDTSGLAAATLNWLGAVNCGILGCPPNGGFARFSQLSSFCRPTGDWVIRATYEPAQCSQVTQGRCCFGVNACDVTTPLTCTLLEGLYGGNGTTCASFTCPFGACCLSDDSCIELTADACQSLGGSYRGTGVTCAAASCATVSRACCITTTMNCVNLNRTSCLNIAGLPGPPGSACASFVCFPMGACCLPNGSCLDNQSPAQCSGLNGTFRGHQVTCGSVVCPLPVGACCVGQFGCAELGQSDCEIAVGGTWAGFGTTCADNNSNGVPDACEPGSSCAGDANGDGDTNGADLSVLLGQFGQAVSPGTGADFNGDGLVNGADLSVLLSSFGCNG